MIGFLIPVFFYDSEEDSQEIFKKHTSSYLFVNAIITTSACVPAMIFMKEKPEMPPSRSQAEKIKIPLLKSIKQLFQNKSYLLLFLCDTAIIGYFNIYGTILNDVYSGYNLTDPEIAILGTIANFAGITGSIFFGILIDKIRAYKKLFTILIGLTILIHYSALIFVEYFTEHAYYICLVLLTSLIFCVIPIYAISMDFICELCYPVGK